MRKAKLILSGVALFAVVGGALAFKAQRGVTSFCRIAAAPGVCTTTYVGVTYFSTTTTTQGITTYCTTVEDAACDKTITASTMRL